MPVSAIKQNFGHAQQQHYRQSQCSFNPIIFSQAVSVTSTQITTAIISTTGNPHSYYDYELRRIIFPHEDSRTTRTIYLTKRNWTRYSCCCKIYTPSPSSKYLYWQQDIFLQTIEVVAVISSSLQRRSLWKKLLTEMWLYEIWEVSPRDGNMQTR